MKVFLAPIELRQPPLGEAPEGFDAIDVRLRLAVHESLLVVHADMFVITHINETIISSPLVGGDDALGVNSAENDGTEGLSPAIGNDLRVDRPPTFKDAKDRLFRRASSPLPRNPASAPRTEVALITFDGAYDPLKLSASMPVDCFPKQPEVSVHSVPIYPCELRCFRCIHVHAEVT